VTGFDAMGNLACTDLTSPFCTDADADGFSSIGGACGPLDCRDDDAQTFPGAPELCGNRIDDDCDGDVDEGCLEVCGDGVDNDGDGLADEACFSDGFDSPALTLENLHPEFPGVWSIDGVGPSQLVIDLQTPAFAPLHWFQGSEGHLFWTSIPGSFVASTRVTATALPDESQAPPVFGGGGVMIRNPVAGPGAANWTNVGLVGAAPSISAMSTVDSNTAISLQAATGLTVEVRVCRVGDSIRKLQREPGGPWTVVGDESRSDLPEEVQVGLFAQVPEGSVRVRFDYLTIDPVETLDGCSAELPVP